MSKIVIIGAGAMGSAFAFPCLDNNHDVSIIGTHLEDTFIDKLKANNNLHSGLNVNIPNSINIFKFDSFDKILKLKFIADGASNICLYTLGKWNFLKKLVTTIYEWK